MRRIKNDAKGIGLFNIKRKDSANYYPEVYIEWLEDKLTQSSLECEWTDILLGIFMTGCENTYANVMINEKLKYCPYCGKNIKIKEGDKNDD